MHCRLSFASVTALLYSLHPILIPRTACCPSASSLRSWTAPECCCLTASPRRKWTVLRLFDKPPSHVAGALLVNGCVHSRTWEAFEEYITLGVVSDQDLTWFLALELFHISCHTFGPSLLTLFGNMYRKRLEFETPSSIGRIEILTMWSGPVRASLLLAAFTRNTRWKLVKEWIYMA